MVQLTRIYTKGGDRGKTSLGDGTRVLKDSLRIEAIGDVDETNATLGLIYTYMEDKGTQEEIQSLQQDLFDLGADLCCPLSPKASESRLQIQEERVKELEKKIDFYNTYLEPLTSFVLPGGTVVSSYLHLSRTVCRRAERKCVSLAQKEYVNPYVIQYLNRLSDFLFVLSRFLNECGKKDILWIPGKNRKKSFDENERDFS
ncbi:MAG: cob(I)yrinic acid a,c-diamide adenosyltransferase [Proteobacteria bacterium]|nr:cob(I)yrinic acid a,c-diamide adenosyltransferase [Pseudomonadota bacterium]